MTKKVVQGNNNQTREERVSRTVSSPSVLKNELTKEFPKEFWQQIAGRLPQSSQNKGEIFPGQIIKPREQEIFNPALASRRREFQLNLTESSLRLRERQETIFKIEEIRKEIAAIALEIEKMGQRVDAVEVIGQENDPQPTDYQLNFLELILKFLKDLREKVCEGNTWLSAFQDRGRKRNHFWNQFKKHGTKYMLSSDRTPATQTG